MTLSDSLEEALPDRTLTHEEVDRIAARLEARFVHRLRQHVPEQGEERVTMFCLLTRNRVALWVDHTEDGWVCDPIAADVSARDFAAAVEQAQEELWGDDVEMVGSTKRIRGKGRHATLEDIDIEVVGEQQDDDAGR